MLALLAALILGQTEQRVPTSLEILGTSPEVLQEDGDYRVMVAMTPAELVDGMVVNISSNESYGACQITIANGLGECTVGGPSLPGNAIVNATFLGSESLAPSQSSLSRRVNAQPSVTVWPLAGQIEDAPILDRWKFSITDGIGEGIPTITLRSGDQSLITDTSLNGNISFEGGYGFVSVRPEPNAHGTIPVTFEVRDSDGATASVRTSFRISPVNDAPSLESFYPLTSFNVDFGVCHFNWLKVDVGPLENDQWYSRLVSVTNPELRLGSMPGLMGGSICYSVDPTQTGAFDVTIEVTDSGDPPLSVQRTFTVTILEGVIFSDAFEH